MKDSKISYITSLSLIILFINSCVEPIDLETQSFESVLVIEATITNEFKFQQINLTRTFKFEDDGPSTERNADVKIIDDFQNIYNFQESEPGIYKSVSKFSAEPNKKYELLIITSDGRSYASNSVELTNSIQIENISVSREKNDLEEESVVFSINSFDPTGNSKFYRFEYEETYKILSRFPSDLDAIILSDTPPFRVGTIKKFIQDKVCYNTIKSNKIIQTETTNFIEDRITKFPIRFINRNDFILRTRYSILVKQYVQSLEAFTYFKVLNELTSSESLFSETQTGFFNGNVFSATNSDEKVLGFFEVASVSTKRIFFDFEDFFPDEDLPPYIADCTVEAPDLVSQDGFSSPLINALQNGVNKYIQDNTDPPIREDALGPFIIAKAACIDCTLLGTNVKPDFWID